MKIYKPDMKLLYNFSVNGIFQDFEIPLYINAHI